MRSDAKEIVKAFEKFCICEWRKDFKKTYRGRDFDSDFEEFKERRIRKALQEIESRELAEAEQLGFKL